LFNESKRALAKLDDGSLRQNIRLCPIIAKEVPVIVVTPPLLGVSCKMRTFTLLLTFALAVGFGVFVAWLLNHPEPFPNRLAVIETSEVNNDMYEQESFVWDEQGTREDVSPKTIWFLIVM
jgi:hypothetical protein